MLNPIRLRRVPSLLSSHRFTRGRYETYDRRFTVYYDRSRGWVVGVKMKSLGEHEYLSPTREADVALLCSSGLGKVGLAFPTRRQALQALYEVAYTPAASYAA